jgi:hypothetical protein
VQEGSCVPFLFRPRYFHADLRILVLLLNPAGGHGRVKDSNETYVKHLENYRDARLPLDELFEKQKEDMSNWRRFLPFYTAGLELDLEEIAFANIAWCASKNNQYPPAMLASCFRAHTAELIAILRPDFLILSGGDAQKFWKRWRKTKKAEEFLVEEVPEIHPLLHFAHRKSGEREAMELYRVREAIRKARKPPNQRLQRTATPHAEAQ